MNRVPVWAAASAVLFWMPRLMITSLLSLVVTCRLERLPKKKKSFGALLLFGSAYVPKVWNQWHLVAWVLARLSRVSHKGRAAGRRRQIQSRDCGRSLMVVFAGALPLMFRLPTRTWTEGESETKWNKSFSSPTPHREFGVPSVSFVLYSFIIGSLLCWKGDERGKKKNSSPIKSARRFSPGNVSPRDSSSRVDKTLPSRDVTINKTPATLGKVTWESKGEPGWQTSIKAPQADVRSLAIEMSAVMYQ